MKYLAILKDSLIETLDRKSLYVMFIVAAFFILVCASFSYSEQSLDEAAQSIVDTFNTVVSMKSREKFEMFVGDAKFKAGALKAHPEGEFAFRLTVTGQDSFRALVRVWDVARLGRYEKDKPVPRADEPIDAGLATRFVTASFRDHGMAEVDEGTSQGDAWTFDVTLKPYSRQTLQGAYRVHYLFGLGSSSLPISVATFVFFIEYLLSEWLAGVAGAAIAIVFTAGFVPNMMQKGTLDVVLARPVRRSTLLLLKYLGGLTYAFLTSLVFIGGSWLVLSWRSGVWNWGYLWTGGTLVFFFAVLYSIGVFFAVLTRNTIAAIVMPFAAWACASAVAGFRFWWNAAARQPLPGAVDGSLSTMEFVLPKSAHINRINQWLMAKGSFGEELMSRQPDMAVPDVRWIYVLCTSLGLIAVMLGLACVIFSRRDH